MSGSTFRIDATFAPSGDQPRAIASLVKGVQNGSRDQVLLGVTGSGKTFTMAKVIETLNRPALVLAHNKTLAGQLYEEMCQFFPQNAVGYFVSYYDYYQPEAYLPRTDTYIAKDAAVNDRIDRLRHEATQAILSRQDVIIVASVSCIYGIGARESYMAMRLTLTVGEIIERETILRKLVEIQYERNDLDFHRGKFRVRGDAIDLFPVHQEKLAIRIELFGDEVETIREIDPLTGHSIRQCRSITLYPANHYVTERTLLLEMVDAIREEMTQQVMWFRKQNKLLEAQRLEERTCYDLEMIREIGYCSGIENYSRYLSGRLSGEPPPTLLEYLPENALLFVDESHVTVPQIRGMFRGDRARKETLVRFGFRLPSALDNRPLTFEEWDTLRPQSCFISATPGPFELERCQKRVIEQIIRPTGLMDPLCSVRPATHQVDDLIHEIRKTIDRGYRTLITTLTKKMAEDLTDYLADLNIAVRYLHADIDTLERMALIRELRLGTFDVLVGINLLREGLDIPEVELVTILDADKEGFLRSETSLVQIIGRAARHQDGRVILYADKKTGSMERALAETSRRRTLQKAYNRQHGITPTSIHSRISDQLFSIYEQDHNTTPSATLKELQAPYGENNSEEDNSKWRRKTLQTLEKSMREAAVNLKFEEAAHYRDQIRDLENRKP